MATVTMTTVTMATVTTTTHLFIVVIRNIGYAIADDSAVIANPFIPFLKIRGVCGAGLYFRVVGHRGAPWG